MAKGVYNLDLLYVLESIGEPLKEVDFLVVS